MRVITLIENLVYQRNLLSEHGLSFYIEGNNKKILFDTGQTNGFIHNAGVLGIDLSAIDAVVISHGHYDHAGGLYDFLKINQKAKVYLKEGAFYPRYHGEKFVGVNRDSIVENRIEYVHERTKIDDGIFIMPDITIKYPEDTHFEHFQVSINNKLMQDTFEDELYMAVVKNNLLTVISSCSHRGIINILEAARAQFDLAADTVLGGFHIRACKEEKLGNLLNYFSRLAPRSIGICHCSGVEKYAWLLQHLGQKVFYNHTGKAILI